MGIFIGIALAIGAALSAVMSVVTAVVAAIATAVSAAIAAVAGAIAAVVSATVITAIKIGAFIAAKVAAMATAIYTQVSATVSLVAHTVSSYVGAIAKGFQAFLNAIHFKTIMAIHNIAFIVSEKYRRFMDRIFRRISKVSEALNLGPHFLNLALRNARAVVLSASTILGRPYDIAEVTWIYNLNGFLEKFNRHIGAYRNHPERIFRDIDKWLIKDSVNLEGSAMQTVYLTVEGIINGTKALAEDIIRLQDDTERFIADLPENMRERIQEHTGPIMEKFNYHVQEVYAPRLALLDSVMSEVKDGLALNQGEIGSVVDRLTRPGDLLIDIDGLSDTDRRAQEEKIASVAFRPLNRDAEESARLTDGVSAELAKLAAALRIERPPPEWKTPEVEIPGRPADTPVEPRKTWFVGDY